MKKNGKMEYNSNGYVAFYTYDGLVRKRHGYVPLSGNGLKYSNNNIINLWKSEFTNDFCYLDRLSFFFNNRDHLGSTRKVVGSDNSIKETINYYPFGSEMRMEDPAQMAGEFLQPYRFTGKELDRVNGLNMYNFGARWYDVAGVPMWTSVDPLAEKYYHISPYAYCGGDPVNYVDPTGKYPVIHITNQKTGFYAAVVSPQRGIYIRRGKKFLVVNPAASSR